MTSFPRQFGLLMIRFYMKCISPFTRPSCRFFPSCSEYAYIALQRHGFLRGSYLAVKRILRCNPWGGHGFDPVPEKKLLESNTESNNAK